MEPYLEYVSAAAYMQFRTMKTDKQLRSFMRMCAGDKKNDPVIQAKIEAEIRSLQDNREKWEALCKDKMIEYLESELEKAEGSVQKEKDLLEKQRQMRLAARTKFHKMSAKQLHSFVSNYHFDEGEMEKILRAVLNAPHCAKGTALLMFWQLEAFWVHFSPTGFNRKSVNQKDEFRERESEREGFILELIARIVSNAFSDNSIPFDLVKYLAKTPSKVKNEHEFVKAELRPHFPRCLTNSKYDASTAW